MNFIHTADWHIGNKMHKVDRKKEYQDFFNWLKNEIENQKTQALIVSGDIFDTGNPSIESRKLYINFLASLLKTDCKNVIIVGGNHDSGALLDSEKEILNELNIHVVGSISNLKPKDMVFELFDDKNNVIGICCAVPYAKEPELREYVLKDFKDGEFSDVANEELYNQVLIEAKKIRNEKDIPIIATGHLYTANLEGRFKDCDNEKDNTGDGRRTLDIVGNLGSVHSRIFSDDFDYVALGHIHYATMVDKNPKIRYSGSPFILGFDEHNIQHGILSVEIEKGKNPDVKKIIVPKTVDWIRLNGNLKEIQKQLKNYISNPPEIETYLELNYDWEENVDFDLGVQDFIQRLDKSVYVANIKRNENQNVGVGGNYSLEDMEDVELSREDIFRALISKKNTFNKTGLSDEEIKDKESELIEIFMPLFREAIKEFDEGVNYEDKEN